MLVIGRHPFQQRRGDRKCERVWSEWMGVNAGYYRQTNNCTTVEPGGSCTVNVTFAPTIVNLQLNAYLVISSNDPDENPVKVLCKGKGVNY